MAFPTFKAKADIPAGFLDGYEEHDGEWRPKPGDDLADLKAKLQDERDKREAAEALTKKAAKELAKLESARKAADAGLTEEQLTKFREDARKDVLDELAPKLAAADAYARENRTLKLDNAVQKHAADAGILPERLGNFMKLHLDEFDLTEDGKAPIVKGAPGTDVAKHVAKLAKGYPEWVQGSRASGGGAAGITPPGAAATPATGSPESRLAAAHAAGKTE